MINDPSPVGAGRQYDETYDEMVRKNELLGSVEKSISSPIYVAYLVRNANSLSWLPGWWTVWDGNYYYYFFDLSGSVVYIESEPQTQGAPASPKSRGTYGFNKAGELVVK